MTGAEYLSASVLQTLWDAIDTAFQSELVESKASIQNFLRRKNAAWPTRFRPEKEPPEL